MTEIIYNPYNSGFIASTETKRNPTRSELIEEAREAFSKPQTEILHDVKRVKNNNGVIVSILGEQSVPKAHECLEYKPQGPKSLNSMLKGIFKADTPKSLFNNIGRGIKQNVQDICTFSRGLWGECTGKLTRYSDSIGTIWVENKVSKAPLKKVLNFIRYVK